MVFGEGCALPELDPDVVGGVLVDIAAEDIDETTIVVAPSLSGGDGVDRPLADGFVPFTFGAGGVAGLAVVVVEVVAESVTGGIAPNAAPAEAEVDRGDALPEALIADCWPIPDGRGDPGAGCGVAALAGCVVADVGVAGRATATGGTDTGGRAEEGTKRACCAAKEPKQQQQQ